MKNQITVSKKDLIRKSKAKHSADLHIALQLYAFYKAEAIKMEPRIPGDDPRRPVPAPMHRLSLLHYLKLLVISGNASTRTSGSNVHHTPAFHQRIKRFIAGSAVFTLQK
jgi:hypothetical protein